MKKLLSISWRLIRIGILIGLIALTGTIIWAATLQLPTLNNFEERRALQSTKIYDRTGEQLLFDFNQDVRRTEVDLDEISEYLQEAAVAIEDDKFYEHSGIRPQSILRAAVANLREGGRTQGGSTITQQVVKNALLTREKSYTRKIKEAILAIRLERKFTKEEILELYLNESPYGGTIYGSEEAAQSFFDTSAADLTLAQAAYMAALPQAPTFYSPYGDNIESLEKRQDLVLQRMFDLGYINETELAEARAEKVTFQARKAQGIKAPHFVFYVRSILEEELGIDAVENGGLNVITTLDLELQDKAETIVKRYAERNATQFNAENAATVAIDPKTGQILTMVGSRDYFDDSFDGQFNASTALRQPGSTFKPFIYATAFDKGYTPETVVFDLPTQFNVNCPATQLNNDDGCYAPNNYDDEFLGPMTFRQALAQSRNIPAVKAFYLAGLEDSAFTAKSLGISTLNDVKNYGLTLVLGGGEVTLVDLASAYAGFADDGRVFSHTPILQVTDASGDELLKFDPNNDRRVLDQQVARQVNDILSDNAARTPAFGPNSLLNIPNVAAKTGTTNDYRDAWTIGYNTDIVVGAWAGNNDAKPMVKKTAGFIITPIWHDVMQEAIKLGYGGSSFIKPQIDYEGLKPMLRGVWRTGGPNSVHSILAYVDKNDPLGPVPQNPARDGQFTNWETSINQFVASGRYLGYSNYGIRTSQDESFEVPDTDLDTNTRTTLSFTVSGLQGTYQGGDQVSLRISSVSQIVNLAVFVDGNLAASNNNSQNSVSFTLSPGILSSTNTHSLRVLATSADGQVGEQAFSFTTSATQPIVPPIDDSINDGNDNGLLQPVN